MDAVILSVVVGSGEARAAWRRAIILEDGGHEEGLVVPLRGVAQGLLAGERVAPAVLAEDVADLDAVGQRLDARGVDLLELLDVVDDLVDLLGVGRQLVAVEPEPGQQGDLGDVLGR